jgi:hypothetical protein
MRKGFVSCWERMSMSESDASVEYEYYIVHDSIGVSHVMRHKKGVHPAIECDDCD